MTEELQPIEQDRYLASSPQPLGFLPTWWFWNDRENWKLVRVPASILTAGLVVAVALLSVPPLLASLIASAAIVLSTGLLERYIRKRVDKAPAAIARVRPPRPSKKKGS